MTAIQELPVRNATIDKPDKIIIPCPASNPFMPAKKLNVKGPKTKNPKAAPIKKKKWLQEKRKRLQEKRKSMKKNLC